jgi:hypothetical protein
LDLFELRRNEAIVSNLIQMPANTYTAKLFESGVFKLAGTLDGFIDLATPRGTYALSLDEANGLAMAICNAIGDVKENCLYERDALLEK